MCFNLFKKTVTVSVNIPKPCGTVDINEWSSILFDKLEEMGDNKAELYPPDLIMKIYKKEDILKASALEEVSSIKYVAEEHDCDDFAAELYGKFASLVWTSIHALNWFIDENYMLWFIEPQTKKLSQTLEDWQGWDVRFFLGR